MKIPFKVKLITHGEDMSFATLFGFGTDFAKHEFQVPMEPAQAKLLSVGDVLELSK
jgi:hypothetical protein